MDNLVVIAALALLLVIAPLPTYIAIARRAENIFTIFVFNVLGCMTVIGWFIPLVMAIMWPTKEQLHPERDPRYLQNRSRGMPPSY
jgi:hypothetical protein